VNLRALYTGLGDLLETLSGVSLSGPADDRAVFPPRTGADAFTELSFKLRTVARVGRDELRTEYDPEAEIDGDTYAGDDAPLGGIVYTATGQRRLMLEVKVECGQGTVMAWPFIERVRDRIQLPSSRDALAALGVAVARVGVTRDMAFSNAARVVSAAVLEIELNAASSEVDAPVTTIEDFEAETDISE
jgi:hypothetical protein